MPTYVFKRRDSGEFIERFFKMADRPDTVTCEDGVVADFDIAATARGVNVPPAGMYPQYSMALAVNPEEVASRHKSTPNQEYRSDGAMIFRSAEHKRKALREIGAIDMN